MHEVRKSKIAAEVTSGLVDSRDINPRRTVESVIHIPVAEVIVSARANDLLLNSCFSRYRMLSAPIRHAHMSENGARSPIAESALVAMRAAIPTAAMRMLSIAIVPTIILCLPKSPMVAIEMADCSLGSTSIGSIGSSAHVSGN